MSRTIVKFHLVPLDLTQVSIYLPIMVHSIGLKHVFLKNYIIFSWNNYKQQPSD